MKDTRFERNVALACLAMIVVTTVCIRLRLLNVPFERDEGEYAYLAQLMLRGIAPFKLAYNMKLPGTSVFYATAMAVFGQTIQGARIGFLIANVLTTILVFCLGKKLLGTLGGLASSIAYATLSISTGMLGLFGHATHFVALFGTAGILVFVTDEKSRRLWRVFSAGVLLGLAFMMKQPGAIYAACAVTWLAWEWVRSRERSWRKLVVEQASLCGGIALPLIATLLWFAKAGVLAKAWFWIVQYGAAYASPLPLNDAVLSFVIAVSGFGPSNALLWLLALAGTLVLIFSDSGLKYRGLMLTLLGFSALGVCPGFYFRQHYFVLALPAAALMVGAACQFVANQLPVSSGRWMAIALVGLAATQAFYSQRDVLFTMPVSQVSRYTYGTNPFPESIEIARYIAAHSRPDDRIAIIGSEPQIYFYARRLSATGFIYTYALMEPQPFALDMQVAMAGEIERAQPAYIVFVDIGTSWLVRPTSPRYIFEWAERYLAERYEIVGSVGIGMGQPTEYGWDAEALRPRIKHLMIGRRRGYAPPHSL